MSCAKNKNDEKNADRLNPPSTAPCTSANKKKLKPTPGHRLCPMPYNHPNIPETSLGQRPLQKAMLRRSNGSHTQSTSTSHGQQTSFLPAQSLVNQRPIIIPKPTCFRGTLHSAGRKLRKEDFFRLKESSQLKNLPFNLRSVHLLVGTVLSNICIVQVGTQQASAEELYGEIAVTSSVTPAPQVSEVAN